MRKTFILILLLTIIFANIKAQELTTNVSHISDILSIKWSTNGKMAATIASYDHNIKIWDVESGRLIRNISDPYGNIYGIYWSKNDKSIISYSKAIRDKYKIRSWDTKTGKLNYTIDAYSFDFSKDFLKLIVQGFDKEIKIYNTETGVLLKKTNIKLPPIFEIRLSSNEKYFLVSFMRKKEIKIFDLISKKEIKTFIADNAEWSFNSDYLFINKRSDKMLKIIETKNFAIIDSLKITSYITQPKWAPKSNKIAFINKSQLSVYDIDKKSYIIKDKKVSYSNREIIWAESEKRIGLLNDDKKISIINLYNTKSDNLKGNLDEFFNLTNTVITNNKKETDFIEKINTSIPFRINNLKISPDNKKMFITLGYKLIVVINIKTGHIINSYNSTLSLFNYIYWSPNSKELLFNEDSNVIVWNIANGEITHKHSFDALNRKIKWSPKGDRIFVTTNNFIKIWDVKRDTIIQNIDNIGRIYSCEWDNKGEYILTSSSDKLVKLWNINTGKLEKSFVAGKYMANQAKFSPKYDKISVIGDDHNIKIWDIKSGKLIFDTLGFNCGITSITWAHDNRRISTTSDFGIVKIWDTKQKKLLFEDKKHTEKITNSKWSKKDKFLVTISDDNTAKIWDVKTNKLLYNLDLHTNNVSSINWINKEKMIITSSFDGSIIVWNNKGEYILKRQFYNVPQSITYNNKFYDVDKEVSNKIYFVNGFKITPINLQKDKEYLKGLWEIKLQ